MQGQAATAGGAGTPLDLPESMAISDTIADDSTVSADDQLDDRDVRALTECMTVLPHGGSMFQVVSESGETYLVDALEDRCECADAMHNLPTDAGRETCKHRARIAFATGERAIPGWVNMDAVDDLLGEQLPGSEPRVAMADGGLFRERECGRYQRESVDGGTLVWDRDCDGVGRELVGVDIDDRQALRATLARRGLGVGALHQLDVDDWEGRR